MISTAQKEANQRFYKKRMGMYFLTEEDRAKFEKIAFTKGMKASDLLRMLAYDYLK